MRHVFAGQRLMTTDEHSGEIYGDVSAGPAGRIDPQAMTSEQAAKILSAAGGRQVTAAMVQAAIDAGAPALADGRVSLIELMAWMERELAT